MRGSIKRRGEKCFALILDLGYRTTSDGIRKRHQKWISFHGTRQQADTKLNELVNAADHKRLVEPTKLTLIEWLRAWLDRSVKPPMRRPETHRVYGTIIENHIAKSSIATMPLQCLQGSDIERYYATLTGKQSTRVVHHAVIHRALRKAVKDKLLVANPAADLDDRPKRSKDKGEGARTRCWSATDARAFLAVAKDASPQLAAFCFLGLDSGARKSELHGLLWTDIDFDAATVTIQRQLDAAGTKPSFGPTKTGKARLVTLGAETIARLKAHRRSQAELKLKNRTTYQDFGLVFAKEVEDLGTPTAKLGQPLKTLSQSRFRSLVKTAGVKPITFHGLRHTCATLLLNAGVPVKVVAERLGHAQASMTLDVYSHALKDVQKDAADRLSAVLHGA